METMWTAVVLVIAGYLVYKWINRAAKYSYPPGPKGWPLIGNVLELQTGNWHLSFQPLEKQYGDIFSVNILGKRIVVLNSLTVIRRALASDEFGEIFANRPQTARAKYTIIGRGIAFANFADGRGTLTKRRKLLHKTLNMYGDGVRESEVLVMDELEHVIATLEKDGTAILEDIFFPSLINIMTIMILGKRFDYDSEEIQTITKTYISGSNISNLGPDFVLSVFPFLRHIPIWIGRDYQKFQRLTKDFFRLYYDEPKATYQPGMSRGLVDVMFRMQEEARKQNVPCWLDDDDIRGLAIDMMGAGILTTRSSLLFFFLTILHQPEVATRIQAEIDGVIGRNRLPLIADRASMPYTEACILETLRLNSQVPLSLPKSTTTDVTFGGCHLPADTMVLVNLWHVHHDETLWEKPWNFQPERFLDDTGMLLPQESQNRRNLMPFSVGRRSCIGEHFAKSRIFLYIATLLQRFHFKHPNTGEALPSMDPRRFPADFIPSPDRYNVEVHRR